MAEPALAPSLQGSACEMLGQTLGEAESGATKPGGL